MDKYIYRCWSRYIFISLFLVYETRLTDVLGTGILLPHLPHQLQKTWQIKMLSVGLTPPLIEIKYSLLIKLI